MKGEIMAKLIGLGVGPGDPELLTLKALRMIKEADVIAVPAKQVEDSVAYQIAKGAYPKINKKNCIALAMPMVKDKKALELAHNQAAQTVISYLEKQQTVVFLTLGDPTVYSTYSYLKYGVEKAGYKTEIVSGIPSFLAAAALMNESLVEWEESLHIIPATHEQFHEKNRKDTYVYLKAGKQLERLKEEWMQEGRAAYMVENCGMEAERLYQSVEEMPDEAGYFTLCVSKGKGKASYDI